MPETDPALQLLRSLADVGVTPPDRRAVRDRVRTAVAAERSAGHSGSGRHDRRRAGRGRLVGGTLALGLSVLVVVVIAVGAITLISHGSGGGSTAPAASSSAGPGARALIAKLAVLRRPQAPADRLPADVDLGAIGTPVPMLTRLVASYPHNRMYLVVLKPSAQPDQLWPARYGDQVAVVDVLRNDAGAVVNPQHLGVSLPVPAADLDNARQISNYGTYLASLRTPNLYHVSIVPDGVARVRWTSSGPSRGTRRAVTLPVRDNAVIQRVVHDRAVVNHSTWYAADGRVIPTSSRLAAHELAALQARLRATALGDARHSDDIAPRTLLSAFAVFGVDSRTGVQVEPGVTISWPRLSALPLAVLQQQGGPESIDPDFRQVREVTFRGGPRLWVIPGARGMEVVSGRGGSTVTGVAAAVRDGAGFTSSDPELRVDAIPKTTASVTLTVGGVRRTFDPAYGVYAIVDGKLYH